MKFTISEITQLFASIPAVIAATILLWKAVLELRKAKLEFVKAKLSVEKEKSPSESEKESNISSEERTDNLKKLGTIVLTEPSKKLKRYKLFIACFAVIGFGLLVFIPGKIFYSKWFIEPYITVSTPKENEKVPYIITIKGNYRNIDFDHQLIWVDIYSVKDKTYFLERKPVNIEPENKEWTNQGTVVGTKYDSGARVEIVVLLVDTSSITYSNIQTYINNIISSGSTALPLSSNVLKRFSVVIQ